MSCANRLITVDTTQTRAAITAASFVDINEETIRIAVYRVAGRSS